MRVDKFDFVLPPEAIALRPVEPRDQARLLCVGARGELRDRIFAELPDLLNPGDQLIVNDTKVLPTRLQGFRYHGASRANVEATLHKRLDGDHWLAFMRPAKKLHRGDKIHFFNDRAFERTSEKTSEKIDKKAGAELDAQCCEKREAGEVVLHFSLSGAALDAALFEVGSMPLPPYIASKRSGDLTDFDDYQTIFANQIGAVAAPTAGLHFTPELLSALKARRIDVHRITLHVGAGTFLPVKVQDTQDHKMHKEWGVLGAEVAEAINLAKARGNQSIAVGTTSLRLLESATIGGELRAFSGETDIFITPGYRFLHVDRLVTNFHLPRSTLFMLVSAFCGLKTTQKAYQHAIENNYRFYSYGDACLLSHTKCTEDL